MGGENVFLETPLKQEFLPVLLAVVENSARIYMMGQDDALKLTLAAEETFSYLCNNAGGQDRIGILCQNCGYYVRLDLLFQVKSFNLRALNITSNIAMDDQAWLEEMGLLIAARSVDRLFINTEERDKMRLSFLKEKTYPLLDAPNLPLPALSNEFFVRAADAEELKEFCRRIVEFYPSERYPSFLLFPGKLVDMVAGKEYASLIAFDGKDNVKGGIIWAVNGEKTIECFGPYTFAPGQEMSEALLDEFLVRAGRSKNPGIINRYVEPATAVKYFEYIGSTNIYRADGMFTGRKAYYRQLNEDMGSKVWAHAGLLDFLREKYGLLVLPRDIHIAGSLGEREDPYSVFTTEFDRLRDQVTLRLLAPGADEGNNLENHLIALRKEKYMNIFFEIDLGRVSSASMVPYLFSCGFKPRLLLPYAGAGDLVLFQYEAGGPK